MIYCRPVACVTPSLAVALVLVGTVNPAQGDELTLPIPGLFRTSYSSARTVLIPRFNPSLGTLTAATIEFRPEYSGTASGIASGPPNAANGWSVEFSGTIRLTAPSAPSVNYPLFNSRSGLVFQPGTPVFEAFGPAALSQSPVAITGPLTPYIGNGSVSASLSWPQFTCLMFWSRGGSSMCTRDLGAIGGSITYTFTPTVLCEPDLTTGATPGQPGYGVPNGVLNNDDFFYYLNEFALGNLAVCDLTTGAVAGQPGYGVPNGVLNNDDFFYYLAIFAAGC